MKYLIQNRYWELNREYDIDKLLYLLIDRPDEIFKLNNNVDFYWLNDQGSLHHRKYNLPAVILLGESKDSIIWHDDNNHHIKMV